MIYLKQNAAVRSFLSNERKFSLCLFQTVLLILGFALSAPSSVSAEGADESSAEVEEIPAFVFESLYAANRGQVYGVYEGSHADLVLIVGGFDSGFRSGMICRVTDGGAEVGEIILVDVRENCSAALIRDLEPEELIAPGQSVRIKAVKL